MAFVDCPVCGYHADAATAIGSTHAPRKGDVSICFRCASLAVFTGDGLLRRLPDADELEAFEGDPELAVVRDLVRRRTP